MLRRALVEGVLEKSTLCERCCGWWDGCVCTRLLSCLGSILLLARDNLGAACVCGVEAGEGICSPAPPGALLTA